MKVNYQYASPSMCLQQGDTTVLGLSPDLSREEKVSFSGRLKDPLAFRDAMLMLREIVISDARQEKKERPEFFAWLDGEIERRVQQHQEYMPEVRDKLQNEVNKTTQALADKNHDIAKLLDVKVQVQKQIDAHDAWKDYYKLERDFWRFIKERDLDLWFVLDPVITVHPDQVSFEAFSVDESIYGCLSIAMEEFELLQQPQLGTTNIDFSAKLAQEMERFRTYSQVELTVNPEGFAVESGVMPEHMEKKIDLPESWIKGFNQVSSAASLDGLDIKLSAVDIYDICAFLRRHKEDKSPRYMKWLMTPGQPIQIVFAPFGQSITLETIYNGQKKREEKIWGRRRWLVLEKLLPLAQSFHVKLLGFGMPQFITAEMGCMKLTVGFTSWSANDWVKGTAFNIMGGFIGDGNYSKVFDLLKQKRLASFEEIYRELDSDDKKDSKAGIGMLMKRGEGYYDLARQKVRFRMLCSQPIDKELYHTTQIELDVQELLDEVMENFSLFVNEDGDFIFTQTFEDDDEARVQIDQDGQITKVACTCRQFKKGARNISEPCPHILALYVRSGKFLRLEPARNKEYKINDILELLL